MRPAAPLRTALLSLAFAFAAAAAARAQPDGTTPGTPGAEDPWRIASKTSYSVKTPSGNRVFSFIDDVVITHGELTATCKRAEYVGENRLVVLTGHVVMTQDSTVVRGPAVTYDRETGVARFPSGVLVERPSGTVVADTGWWWRHDDRFELRGRAAAADTSGTLDADAMTWDGEQDLLWAIGDGRFVDDVSGVIVEGQSLRYDRAAALAVAGGEPVATFEDEDGTDVRVTAERITYDPAGNVAVAKGDVHVRRETMEATAGIVRFERDRNRVLFREDPVIVDGRTEIRGERIELEMPGDGRRVVHVKGGAQVSSGLNVERGPDAAPVAGDAGPAAPEGPIDRDAGPAAPEAGDAEPAAPEADTGPASPPDTTAAPGDAGPAPGPVAPAPGKIRDDVRRRAQEILGGGAAGEGPAPGDAKIAAPGPAKAGADSILAAAEERASAPGDSTAPAEDVPEWLRVAGEDLPRQNLLFGDEITIEFRDDGLERVTVVGHGRSKFFPSEDQGDLSEWNDVVGDTLHVWFADAAVESVMVLGHGVGEYRLSAGEDEGASADRLKELGKLVDYSAPVIRYNRVNEVMHLSDGAKVEYKTMVLNSGTIDFDPNREVMTAAGDPPPILVDRQDEIRGGQMRYHLGEEKGEILSGRTKFEDAFYQGDDIWKVGEDVMAVEGASFTTCDLEQPHYHFASKQMKIYLDDKVVAKPIVLKIREIPVFALPFYMASLKKGRHSGFLLPNIELGVDSNRGRFIRNLGYYWAPNDYADGTLTFDFYPSQDRIVTYLSTRYNVRYRFSGQASLKYNRDVPQNRKDTALELSHQQTLSETMTLSGDARFLSSQNVYREIDDSNRLDRDIRSHLTFTKRFPGSNRSLRAEVERRENLDTGAVDETLPAVTFSQPSRPILGLPERAPGEEAPEPGLLNEIYYSLDSRFVRERSRREDSLVEGRFNEDRHAGAKANTNVRTTKSLGPYLRMSPAVNGEGAWVDKDQLGDANRFRATYNTSLTASTNLYGTFLRPIGPTRGFRHVIEPSMSWSWAPEFREYFYADSTGTLRDRFASFGGIGGTQRETNRMSFAMRNLVQTKLAQGETERRYDLFTLRNSISYDLLAKDAGRKPLSSLGSTLNVLSALPVNQSWTVSHDPYSWDLQSTSVTTRARLSSQSVAGWFGGGGGGGAGAAGDADAPGGGDEFALPPPDDAYADDDFYATSSPGRRGNQAGLWSIDASHTARRAGAGNLTSSIVFNSSWNPTPLWSVRFNTQYDLRTGENTSQSWTVHRTVHCWEISFDRSLLGGEWQYYLRVNVTDLPDIQAERGDRFRGRRTTSSLDSLF